MLPFCKEKKRVAARGLGWDRAGDGRLGQSMMAIHEMA